MSSPSFADTKSTTVEASSAISSEFRGRHRQNTLISPASNTQLWYSSDSCHRFWCCNFNTCRYDRNTISEPFTTSSTHSTHWMFAVCVYKQLVCKLRIRQISRSGGSSIGTVDSSPSPVLQPQRLHHEQ
jgi:hypothetical protein